MRIICGLLGSLVGLVTIIVTPPPNLQLTSVATGYDIWTGHPHLAWKIWVPIAAVILGFFLGSFLYSRQSNE